jgi:hypothetical protein
VPTKILLCKDRNFDRITYQKNTRAGNSVLAVSMLHPFSVLFSYSVQASVVVSEKAWAVSGNRTFSAERVTRNTICSSVLLVC